MKSKKPVQLGLLTAIALTIFLVENQIPALVPIPGVKIGLANIVTVFTVFLLGSKEGAAASCITSISGASRPVTPSLRPSPSGTCR